MSDPIDQDEVVDIPTKKRKREANTEDELEIDVNLPEPPSKKALRKAKKEKSKSGSTSTKPVQNGAVTSDSAAPAKMADDTVSVRSAHSVWIGNLPFTITKAILRNHLVKSSIPDETITRIHIPAPANAQSTKTTLKPQNKGFAYVDFSTSAAFDTALALSETQLAGRALLIKDAKSFEGRPQKKPSEDDSKNGPGKSKTAQPPSRRIFVGNLGFDVTKEDLTEHFAPCGEVENIHMATFEDSGKCKGFAWVTFAVESVDRSGKSVTGEGAAGAAVQGYTFISPKDNSEALENGGANGETQNAKEKKQNKARKWFVNRLQGRVLRCEFAEDPSTRYKKRFGKDPSVAGQRSSAAESHSQDQMGESDATEPFRRSSQKKSRGKVSAGLDGIEPGAPTDLTKRRGKGNKPEPSEETRYRTGAIATAKGSKVVFD